MTRRTKTWLPASFRRDWPIANAFCSGVLARSLVEIATVPLRSAAPAAAPTAAAAAPTAGAGSFLR